MKKYLSTLTATIAFTGLAALWSQQASAQNPTVVTGYATGIGPTSATLVGTVNANGSTAIANFQYGLTTNYGPVAGASPSFISGSSPTQVILGFSNLTPGTLYHFRTIGTNSNSSTSVYGADATFTTQPQTVPDGVGCSVNYAVPNTYCTFHASVNPNNAPTHVTIEWGPGPSYGHTNDVSPNDFDGYGAKSGFYDAYGLQPNTTYHYRTVAHNYFGYAYGDDNQFTTGFPAAVRTVLNNATVHIFPNPTSGSLQVDAGSYHGELALTVYDATGRTMRVPAANAGNIFTLSTGNLASGTYWLQLTNGAESFSTSFSKR